MVEKLSPVESFSGRKDSSRWCFFIYLTVFLSDFLAVFVFIYFLFSRTLFSEDSDSTSQSIKCNDGKSSHSWFMWFISSIRPKIKGPGRMLWSLNLNILFSGIFFYKEGRFIETDAEMFIGDGLYCRQAILNESKITFFSAWLLFEQFKHKGSS